jgi:hypothetical protein
MKTKYIIILLIFFILFVSFFNEYMSEHSQDKTQNIKQEGFTPSLRKIYRPHIRNIRVTAEGFYKKHVSNLHNIARKFGIM